jgi:phosphoserine phosphatase RsbU/P
VSIASHKRSPFRPPQQSEQELRLKNQALAAVQDCVAVVDASLPEIPIIYVNTAFERVTGYSAAEAAGRHYSFLQGSASDPVAREKLRIAILEQRACTVELLNYRKDGKTFLSRICLTPIRDEEGKVTHFLAVQSDITEQKRIEEALDATNRALQEAYVDIEQATQATRNLQQALTPPEKAEFEGARFISGIVRCAEQSGDLLNFFSLDERRIGFYLADIRGHGMPAALGSILLSHLLLAPPAQSLLYRPRPGMPGQYEVNEPVELIEKLSSDPRLDGEISRCLSLLYATLDTQLGELRYVSVGQIGMALLPGRGEMTLVDPAKFPVYLYPEATYEQKMAKLHAGDRVYVCSDGVLDALNEAGERFGMEGFLEAAKVARGHSLDQSVASILDSVKTWRAAKSSEDDASVLALETTR